MPPIQELHPQLPQVLRQPQLPQVLRQPHVPHDPQLDPHEVQDDVQQVLQHDWQQLAARAPPEEGGSRFGRGEPQQSQHGKHRS